MTAEQMYVKETGNKPPCDQIALHYWYIDYVQWLEKKLEESHSKPTRPTESRTDEDNSRQAEDEELQGHVSREEKRHGRDPV